MTSARDMWLFPFTAAHYMMDLTQSHVGLVQHTPPSATWYDHLSKLIGPKRQRDFVLTCIWPNSDSTVLALSRLQSKHKLKHVSRKDGCCLDIALAAMTSDRTLCVSQHARGLICPLRTICSLGQMNPGNFSFLRSKLSMCQAVAESLHGSPLKDTRRGTGLLGTVPANPPIVKQVPPGSFDRHGFNSSPCRFEEQPKSVHATEVHSSWEMKGKDPPSRTRASHKIRWLHIAPRLQLVQVSVRRVQKSCGAKRLRR